MPNEKDKYHAVLTSIRNAIVSADPEVLTDTLWMPGVMSQTVVDFIDAAADDHLSYVDDERERCARLCETLALIQTTSAKSIRLAGMYYPNSFWPFWQGKPKIMPGAELHAKALDASAYSLNLIASGCRKGWDARKLEQ